MCISIYNFFSLLFALIVEEKKYSSMSTTIDVDFPIRQPQNAEELADLVKKFDFFFSFEINFDFFARFKIQLLTFKKNLDK